MFAVRLLLVSLAVASATATVFNETNQPEKQANSTATSVHSTPPATAKSSDEPEEGGSTGGNLRKRTIEQTVGYGYRYNTVLRPISASSPQPTSQRRGPAFQQRAIPPSGPSPSSPASYYFQQQIQSTASPKPVHRFQAPSYPRTYSRQEPTETRPVTEAQAPFQPPQDANIYKEVFTFEDAMPPYQLAPRAEQFLAPQAFFLASNRLGGQAQQVIPVLILRLDAPAHFPYPMMAMQVVPREDINVYGGHGGGAVDPSQLGQQYADSSFADLGPNVAYFTAATQQPYAEDKRRMQPLAATQLGTYRGSQSELPVGKVGLRRPATGASSASSPTGQAARTEVTVHHSPGMSAQDYKESVEEQEEA